MQPCPHELQTGQSNGGPHQAAHQHLQPAVTQAFLEGFLRSVRPERIRQTIDPFRRQPGGATNATGVVHDDERHHRRKGEEGVIKAQGPAHTGRRAGDQGGVARRHAAGFDQHRRTPTAMQKQLKEQL